MGESVEGGVKEGKRGAAGGWPRLSCPQKKNGHTARRIPTISVARLKRGIPDAMCPHGYYQLMRESKDPRHLRLRMVQQARRRGIKPAARLFGCSPNTIRKWTSRFDGSLESLSERSRAPRSHPNRLSHQAELQIVKAKRKLPTWGIARLKRDMDLPHSTKTIRRVLKERSLLRRYRRKKHHVKRCLREIKRNWALWQQITADTKDLIDLPEYQVQARRLGLPRHQYTAREVSTGALFLGFSDELSLTYAQLFAERIQKHLAARGVEMARVTWQTDNGSEFIGSWQAVEKSAFTKTIESVKSTHRTIPPGAHRFQSDVETVHSLMETEFYIERFKSRADFLSKATTYQNFFNYVRPNSGKENLCPFDLVSRKQLNPPLDLLYLPPVFLEALLRQRIASFKKVHHVGVHP